MWPFRACQLGGAEYVDISAVLRRSIAEVDLARGESGCARLDRCGERDCRARTGGGDTLLTCGLDKRGGGGGLRLCQNGCG